MNLLKFVTVLLLALLSGCGGGGGGGGGGQLASRCNPDDNSNFYEVTANCASPLLNNLKTTIDLSGGYAYADGGVAGGNGGGGGDGGGSGAGDSIIMRIARVLVDGLYNLLGVHNVVAQTISACGPGVSPSDLNKLTATGWVYQPIVKSSTAPNTACVKSIFDVNKYLLVYASGVVKNDQTCYLILVNKLTGRSHCFSSAKTMNLADDFDYANHYSEQITSEGNTFAVSKSQNGSYLAVMLRSRDTGGTGASYYLATLKVDDDLNVSSRLLLDGPSFFPRAEISSGSPVFRTFAVTNSGSAYVNFYKNLAGDPLRQSELITTEVVTQGGVSTQHNMHVERKSDGSRSDQTGYTYFIDRLTGVTTLLNNNAYANPQCWMAAGNGADNTYFTVMKNLATGRHDLLGFNGGNAYQVLAADTSVCLNYNASALLQPDGKLYFYKLMSNPTRYSGKYYANVSYIVPNGAAVEVSVFDVPPPVGVACSGSSVTADLYEASMYRTSNNSLVVAARTEPQFGSDGVITSGGLSSIGVYSLTHGLQDDRVPYTSCMKVRRIAQSFSSNFGYVEENYEQVLAASLLQRTYILDAAFAQESMVSKSGQNFKLGFTLSVH